MKNIDHIKRFQQPGTVECGPAAVCAAISLYPEWMPKFSVGSVITAAGVTDTIQNRGTTVAELAKAVEVLSDRQLKLLYKVGGTIDDIRELLGQNVPVVVDWQGSTLEGSDGNKGHYSLVVGVDDQVLQMVDSLPDFPGDRIESINSFESLWWDTDSVLDKSGQEKIISTKHLLFIIVPTSKSKGVTLQLALSPGNTYPGS